MFAISSGSAMPMTAFSGYTLSGGLLKDFGDALAAALQLTPRYLLVPRKRVEEMLQTGKADIVCDLKPEWLDGKNYAWSSAIFTNNLIVASRTDTPPANTLRDLRDARLGTIHGYRYPEIDAEIGVHYTRDDAMSDEVNLAKLVLHRFDYIVTNSLYFDYARYVHPSRQQLNAVSLKINSFNTYCAIRPDGKLTLAQLNRAIDALHRRGAIDQMMARYRTAPK
ncbi:substrate-binding periplasmic protein [Duganella sacchari]|uniref:substrate-binding periplasmic protein n=1 Tax=Duganella sacchari TaxID=551987 RepID=UPI001E54AB56|nr:transporter substrate-binding domain-containing protein [Duganella sacchari]